MMFLNVTPPSPAPFVLASNRKAACSIVLPPSPTVVDQTAAKELQDTLHLITGADFTVVTKAAKGAEIRLLHNARLGSEGYEIRCNEKGLTISGGSPRGLLYGCIGLLQDHLECRWYTSTVASIPSHTTLMLQPFVDREKPAFEYREPFFTEAWDTEWDVHNRCNGNSMPLTAAQGGRVQYGEFVHTFSSLVPPDKYFATHPEYFALVNGKRDPAQLELTNPAVLKIAIATVKGWIKANPDATIFSVSQNDNYAHSQSPETLAIDKKEGSPSGLVLQFVNKVAKAIGKEYPHVLIDTLAYQWTEKPPLFTRPLPNVRVRLAPIGADYAHALDKSPQNKAPYGNLVAWGKITHQLYIWSYCTNFAHYLQPLPDIDEIVGDIPLFKKNGVVGVFYEGDYAPGGGGDFAELKSYLIAQLLWNPQLDAQDLIQDYVKHVYGSAAPDVMAWINLLHRAERTNGFPASIYDSASAPYFSDAMLAEAEAVLKNGLKATASEPMANGEVQKLLLDVQYTELMRTAPNAPTYRALADTVAKGIRQFGIQQTSEGGSAADFLKSIGE